MKPIAITPGEPAGIGPDIVIQAAQEWKGTPLVVIADPLMMQERALSLGLQCDWPLYDENIEYPVSILPVQTSVGTEAGKLDPDNVAYVLKTIVKGARGCLNGSFSALVTGPVHKGIINEAGYGFTGQTDFLAELTETPDTVMTFLTDFCPVALMTTHLPLRAVPDAITPERIRASVRQLRTGLQRHFGIKNPHIAVAGLNPHAGEDGHLGREEIDVMIPTIQSLQAEGIRLSGPISADGLFSPISRLQYDAILSPYHDQALPVVKALGFGTGVQMSLGLPLLRISVDHGTALTLAGTGRANHHSLLQAIYHAEKMQQTELSCHE